MRVVTDIAADIEQMPSRRRENFPELANEKMFWDFYERARLYSMVHVGGFYNAFRAMQYIAANKLRGDIVECGCFLGGMTAFLALLRNEFNLENAVLAFDSFSGFPIGSVDAFLGKPVGGPQYNNFKSAVIENIKAAVGSMHRIDLIEGYVENTIPESKLDKIALLRLDTDHYESTRIELSHLYPKLISGGVIIIDDYGLYQGSRRATDEYIGGLSAKPMLNRMDHGVWSGVKP
jgi:O-methyltransferase